MFFCVCVFFVSFEHMPGPGQGTTISDGAAKSILRGSATVLAVRHTTGKNHSIEKSGHANDVWKDKNGKEKCELC